MKRLVTIVAAVLILMGGLALLAPPSVRAQAPRGAFVDSLLWFSQENQAQAMLDLKAGTMDMYLFQLRTAADIAAARQDPELRTVDVGGSYNNLFINPVPVNQTLAPGKVNPFEIQEARESLNYLIDRDFIQRELLGGSGYTHTTMWHRQSPEYGRDAVFMSQLESRYAYNPSLGRQILFDALGRAGYQFESGLWRFGGNPVTLTVVIRTEDARREIGLYIADVLEDLGFLVDRQLRTGGGAFAIVYDGPPDTGAWHLYTEGWAATALSAWADSDPFFFYNGDFGSRIWLQYRGDPELVDVAEALFFAEYTSLEERQSLTRRASELVLKNSVRVWLFAGATFAWSERVHSFVYDLSGGPWALMASRTARFADANGNPITGGDLKIGQRIHFLSAWNVWGGFSWLYDQLQAYAFQDAALFPNPHTGLWMPIRSQFQVQTPGPTGSIAVPGDALTWDNATFGFTPVSAGTTARSLVNYTFTFGTWHDGEPLDMDDVLYEIALLFRRARPEGDINQIDPLAGIYTGTQLFNALFRGFRVVDADTIQIWYDYWHPDASTIASTGAVIWPSTPWTASELAMQTVLDGVCAVNEATAEIQGIDALDLSKGPCLAAMDGAVGTLAPNHRPPGLDAYITTTEASTRWGNLQAFRAARGHFFPSNGPFVLSEVRDVESQTIMTRDPNYPFEADAYDSLITPKVPTISFGTAPQVIPGLPTTFTINSRLAGAAYDEVVIDYLLVDPSTGGVIDQGSPSRTGAGTYQVNLNGTLTGRLEPGAYELRAVAVGLEAAIPVIASQAFIAIPELAHFQTLLAQLEASFNADLTELQNDLADQQEATTSALNAVAALQTLTLVAVILAVVAIAVAVVVVAVAMRRRPAAPARTEEL